MKITITSPAKTVEEREASLTELFHGYSRDRWEASCEGPGVDADQEINYCAMEFAHHMEQAFGIALEPADLVAGFMAEVITMANLA